MFALEQEGFEIVRGVIPDVSKLIGEVERVTAECASACLREIDRRSPRIAHLAESTLADLLPAPLGPVRAILFDKTSRENWPVGWHQDLSIAVRKRVEVDGYSAWTIKGGVPHVQPPMRILEQMVTVRLHLDDTPASNGALRVVPRSHLRGRIPSAAVMTEIGKGQITCECAAGDVLLMKPLLLHASSRSQSSGHRRVIHIEYACRESLDFPLQWQFLRPGPTDQPVARR